MKTSLFLLLFLFVEMNGTFAQVNEYYERGDDRNFDRANLIDVKLGMTPVNAFCDSLSFNYSDDDGHLFKKNFSLAAFPIMYGGEFNLTGYTFTNKMSYSGLGVGIYLGGNSLFTTYHTGVGYKFVVNKRIKIAPCVNFGYARMSYNLGGWYTFDDGYADIKGHILVGPVKSRLLHNSFFASPQVALDYLFTPDFSFRFTVGYRMAASGYERILFEEATDHRAYASPRAKNVHASDGIFENGQAINHNAFGLSGVFFGIGIFWAV